MGLLDGGSPLSWAETKKNADLIRETGIKQFLSLYERFQGLTDDCLKWGDEIEFTVVHFDHDKKTAQVQLTDPALLERLQQAENADPGNSPTAWRPEYGSFMLEATPGKPFGGATGDFNEIEPNMKLRHKELNEMLAHNTRCMNITCFPRLGCPSFSNPSFTPKPDSSVSRSAFFPDEAINPHPRFSTLTRNIRTRRGSKIAIHVPIFKDVNTPSPFLEDMSQHDEETQAGQPDHIYMDAMGFGMGMSCLQVTFQACSLAEGRLLYDQLTAICPIVLALSASTPIYRGYLSDRDCRWAVIEQSVDDRTREERGLDPLENDKYRIPKSRYSPVSCYLASEKYNDQEIVQNQEVYDTLRTAGIDHLLATHIAHLFIRDPLTLFSEQIDQSTTTESNHFENIQSTNWQSMRFKPPPASSHAKIGWRVEFRPADLQLTPFENAALVMFVVILTRTVLSLNLNFYIPISKMEENMRRAQERNAVLDQKFYFRKNVYTADGQTAAMAADSATPSDDDYEEMSIDTIVNGKDGVFPGLLPLMDSYLRDIGMDVASRCTVSRSFELIRKRATGELKTVAKWMRDFVAAHPHYKQDSVINERVNYDLLMACDRISSGTEHCHELEGDP
ncbi:LOW QUALITY PROTEIN: glutamate--cysteine ligase catalytic subunit-like [Sycon ciliatum]|uniref:LOW QUALITY PROTEIN: glutamate--cysteine ligase catalytic subunit-like n=1 Tax=Sycon ciliatum TaxID=27933 RepID=UPI0031F70585